jgi:3-phenylpropionate/trans-cinnamate dioxygenase ferredoxin reductase subunit
MGDVSYVIVGAGLAGVRAAEALRRAGVDGDIIMVGDEVELPYERPELSKGYLAGERARIDLTVHEDGWYARNDVEMLLGRRAVAVHPGRRTVLLEGAERVGYDRLLLATGSRARRLRVPGEDLDGVQYLRRAADADSVRAAIAGGGPLLVVGGGWVGLEVAAVARAAGVDVTVVEVGPEPLAGLLGPELGRSFADLHREHGVRVLTRTRVRAVLGTSAVEGVRVGPSGAPPASSGDGGTRGSDEGETVDAAGVIVAIGSEPLTELAVGAGLPVADGVLVDETLQTADPRIWCAGDLAGARNAWLGGRLRVEQFASAAAQGTLAGRGMAGDPAIWQAAPYFVSRQYGATISYHGHADPGTCRMVLRPAQGDDGAWSAFWLRAGRVVAALEVNLAAGAQLRDLVTERARVDPDHLANPAVPLPRTRTA